MAVNVMNYLGLLVAGETDRLADNLSDNPVLDDPAGHFSGKQAVLNFLRDKSAKLQATGARAERVRLTVAGQRGVDEQLLTFRQDGQDIHLPYAVVIEVQPNGKTRAIRTYHSHWAMLHKHLLRPAILKEDKTVHLSDVVGQYHQALTDASVDGVMAAYEVDGYAREPAGNEYTHRGHAELRPFYTGFFAIGKGGGIILEHCTATDDGVACALEYNVVMLGGIPLTPQAGVAVYERGTSGKLHAARIYDDVAVE